jgi:DNA-binding FadR family transcriptional regulator
LTRLRHIAEAGLIETFHEPGSGRPSPPRVSDFGTTAIDTVSGLLYGGHTTAPKTKYPDWLMEQLISRIEPQKRRYELVADKLQEFIVLNHYNEGDLLPTERKLTELLGVSRTVVRESFKILTQKGLLEIRPGKGAVVTRPNTEVIAGMIELQLSFTKGDTQTKLVEVRRTLETEIAALAAARRSKADLKLLEETVTTMMDNRENQLICNQADLSFHLGLAQASHNELYGILLAPIRDLLFQAMERVFEVKNATNEAIDHHQRILACVKAGDTVKARQEMHAHLDQFERVLKASQRLSKARV